MTITGGVKDERWTAGKCTEYIQHDRAQHPTQFPEIWAFDFEMEVN